MGLDEFARWLTKVGSELMYAVNLGTRGVEEALDVLEYANLRGGTELSDRRIANGAVEPYDIRMWCLGNEMDGPVAGRPRHPARVRSPGGEDGTRHAADRPRRSNSSSAEARARRCRCSAQWERIVLEETYDEVDFISCHAYYEPFGGDYGSFLASAVNMDRFIESVVATADHVKAVRGSDKTINISFDEWNVWYLSRYEQVDKITDAQDWPVAPRLLEDVYSVVDAVVFGNLLISLIRHADRVTAASLAQLVNVIAPIMTEPGGAAWRQTTFFPFAVTSRLARGVTLELKLDCPTYESARHGVVPVVDAVATHDEATGDTAVFLVNRSLDEAVEIVIDTSILGDVSVGSAESLHDDDMHAANTRSDPERVGLKPNDTARLVDHELHITLPPVSWTAVTLR